MFLAVLRRVIRVCSLSHVQLSEQTRFSWQPVALQRRLSAIVQRMWGATLRGRGNARPAWDRPVSAKGRDLRGRLWRKTAGWGPQAGRMKPGTSPSRYFRTLSDQACGFGRSSHTAKNVEGGGSHEQGGPGEA